MKLCRTVYNNVKKKLQKKIEFFNKIKIIYEFLTVTNIKIHIKFMFS